MINYDASPRPLPDCALPVKLTVPLAEANTLAQRAFWRGALIFGAVGFGTRMILEYVGF